MSILDFGPAKLRFNFATAEAFATKLGIAMTNIESARSTFASQAAQAQVDFAGVFAQIFRDHVGWANVDAENIVTCLKHVQQQVNKLIESARQENADRDATRTAREEKYAELLAQYANEHETLGTAFPRQPSIAQVQLLVPFTPGTAPASSANDVSLRQRDGRSAGSHRAGGTTSARPENLRKFSGAQNPQSPGPQLQTSEILFSAGTAGWGYVSTGNLFSSIKRWYESNADDRQWLGRLATEFEKAGGSGGLHKLADSAIAAALSGAGMFPTRSGLDLQLPQTLGSMPGTGYAADPVNTATGNFIEPETDCSGTGPAERLVFTRMYNSQDAVGGAFGLGWSSTLDVRLEFTDERAEFVMHDGRRLFFPRDGAAWGRALHASVWLAEEHWDPDSDTAARGAQQGEAQQGEPTAPRLVVRDNTGAWWAFTRAGAWLATGAGPGTTVRVERDGAGRVSALAHEFGRRIAVAYDASGSRPARVTGPDGQHTTFRYDGVGRLVEAVSPAGARAYRWNDDGLVDRVTGANGVIECENTYDSKQRVVTQHTPHGRDMLFSYLSGRVTVVADRDGEHSNSWVADKRGRLVGVTDTDGNRQSMSYDAHGNLVSLTERDGTTTVHAVDERGRRTRTVTPEGADTRYEWDDQDRLTRITATTFVRDPRDRTGAASAPGSEVGSEPTRSPSVTEFEYASAADRQPHLVTDAMGGVTRLTWERGLLTRIVDPVGVALMLGYDGRGDLVSTADALGNETVLTRDEAGRVTRQLSATGAATAWQYDPAGNVSRREDPDGAVWRYEYAPGGQLTAQIDPVGARTEYEYGPHGDLARVRDPLGRLIEQRFDTFGNPAELTLPDGASWQLRHDGLSRLREVIDPDGGSWRQDYSPTGEVAATVDPTGVTRRFTADAEARTATMRSAFTETVTEFDEFGRPVRATGTDGAASITVYDLCGRVVEELDADGGLTRFVRDAAGRVVLQVSPAGRETRFEYDACGRPSAMIDGEGGRTEISYDADSRVVERRHPNGEVSNFKYDACGRLVAERAPGAGVGRYRYDLAGQLVAAQDTRFGQRKFAYDAAGQLITAVNGAGGKTDYDYDELGRVASITDPAGGVTRRTYTALSRVATLTDPLGRVTTGTYDQAGKQLTQTDPDGREVAWAYDADGQPCGLSGDGAPLTVAETDHRTHTVTATDHTRRGTGPVSHRIVRDRLGRMIERTRDGETTRWEYDGDGLRTLMVTPSGEEVRYGYDRAGRVTRVEHSAFGAISYDYDPSGNLIAAVAGETAQAWRYDDGYPVEHTLTTGDGVETTRISRGEGGRITEIADASGSTAYGYDGAEQLVRAEHRDGGGASTLHEWEYDLAGRLVFDRGAEGETRYDYDLAGQLSRRVAVHGSGDDGTTTYAYDGAGRRTLEAGPHGEKRYEWDTRGWLSAITDGTSTQRLWVDGYGELAAACDEPVSWDSAARFPALTGLGSDPVFAAPGGMTGLGTALAPTGWRQARSTSALNPWDITGAFQPGPPLAPGIGVTGHGTPTIGGLEWMGARAYDRVTRGFLSVDPLEPVTGAGWAGNPYAYAGNDPLHALDPLGRSPLTDKDLKPTKEPGFWEKLGNGISDGWSSVTKTAGDVWAGFGEWARSDAGRGFQVALDAISAGAGFAALATAGVPGLGAALAVVSLGTGLASTAMSLAADPASFSSVSGVALAALNLTPVGKITRIPKAFASNYKTVVGVVDYKVSAVSAIVGAGQLAEDRRSAR